MRAPLLLMVSGILSCNLAGLNGCGSDDDDDDEPATIEREPNDTSSQANLIEMETAVDGTIAVEDVDYFKFQVPADFDGYKITATVVDENGDCFTGADPNLEILASDGKTSLYWQEDSVENYCPSIAYVADAGLQYYARVGTAVGLQGVYTLRIREGGPGTISGTVSVGPLGNGSQQSITAAPVLAPIMEGELLVQATTALAPQALAGRLSEAFGLEVHRVRPVMGGRYHLMKVALPDGLDRTAARTRTLDLVAIARHTPGILSSEPNRLLQPDAVPSDSGFFEQWDMMEAPGMNAVGAWDSWKGTSDTVVAVIDTGHDADHPDLVEKAAPGYDFITNADNAHDGDGPDSDPADATFNGHGTHVAGTVAASTDNGLGVAGVGWNVRYMPLRVCGNYGCTEADIIEAIQYAAGLLTVAGEGQTTARARVINLSLGGNDYCSSPMQDAITAATLRGVVVVAASGNQGEDAAVHSPGNCLDVVGVGASDPDMARAGFSNYGATVDVMAPGYSIYSTYEGGGYAFLSGTSMASPHVAGLVGLLKDINPTFSFDTIVDLLEAHGIEVDCGTGGSGCGAGLIDAAASVNDALTRPDDPAPAYILVQAVNVADPNRVYNTVVRDGRFLLDSMAAGTYLVQAGYDNDGDYALDDLGDNSFDILSETITLTARGEDVGGIHLVLE